MTSPAIAAAATITGDMSWSHLCWATALNLLYLALAAGLVGVVLRVALDRGLLPKIR